MSAEPQVKGLAYRSVLTCLERARGESTLKNALEAAPPELRDMYNYGSLVASAWYPLSWYRAMWAAIAETTGEGTGIAREIGRAAIEQDMNLVHKVLFRVLSPETIYRSSSRLFNNYYDTGTFEMRELSAGYASCAWLGCRGFSHLMWEELLASSVRVLELAGAKDVRARAIAGGGDNEPDFEAEARWSR